MSNYIVMNEKCQNLKESIKWIEAWSPSAVIHVFLEIGSEPKNPFQSKMKNRIDEKNYEDYYENIVVRTEPKSINSKTKEVTIYIR